MHRVRRLGRGGRLLLAFAVAGAAFGVATAVQASIPDSNAIVHSCYNTSLAHGNPIGAMRAIDTSTASGNCAPWEGAVDLATPQYVQNVVSGNQTFVASGFVSPTGSVVGGSTIGPIPTVTHLATGVYGFTVTGLGVGCVLPQLTGLAGNFYLFYGNGSCGGGGINTDVFTSNGADEFWGYLVVGSASPTGAASTHMAIPAAHSG
jgi:hypothetical protein